jgi:hypothetical protein
MATKNKELAVWAEVVAVHLATTKKGKIVLLPTGVMRQWRHLPNARIVVMVEGSEVAIKEETGWNEVNFLLKSFSFQSECFQLFILKTEPSGERYSASFNPRDRPPGSAFSYERNSFGPR